MLIAAEYLGKVGIGATDPEFFRANDGKIYVVKSPYNSLGKKVLISELIAAKFGKFLNLPFPNSDLIDIKNFFPSKNKIKYIGFASEYISDSVYATNENISHTDNLNSMAGVILFDHLFHNSDRTNNRKNLLVAPNGNQNHIYAIDHSHLFRTGHWTIELLNKLSDKIDIYTKFIYGVLLRRYLTLADFMPYLQRIDELSHRDIQEIIANVPDYWFQNISETAVCYDFICKRCALAETITTAIFAVVSDKNN